MKCQAGFSVVIHVFQLLSIVHEINSSFDCDPTIDFSGVFLDISKAFDEILFKNIWR